MLKTETEASRKRVRFAFAIAIAIGGGARFQFRLVIRWWPLGGLSRVFVVPVSARLLLAPAGLAPALRRPRGSTADSYSRARELQSATRPRL